MTARRAIVVSHTHWDREWYLPLWEHKFRLLYVLDKAINLLLEEPRFACFILDGQVAALEDYLELRPEMSGVVRRLVSEGRLLIGPFYTQPDEFLVSGEAIVRNLLLGIRIARDYGGCSMVGYLPDTFGHTAQLPQILRGFGIDNFFFMRGLGDEEEELGTEFLWEAPDGSRVLAIYFREGFCNANMLGLPIPHVPVVWRAPEGWYTVFHSLYFGEPKPDFKNAESRVMKLAETLLSLTRSGTLLLMNGCDHQPPQSSIVKVIEYLNSSNLGIEFVHGSLEDYLNIVRLCAGELRIYKGELRGAKRHPILANVLSTRAYLKKLNYRAQVLLEKYAEPLSVLAMLAGLPYPSKLLLLAWKLLLQNHAHDSIYGSGSDPVHVDNESRFYQVISIASNIAYEAGRAVAELCKRDGDQLSVFVYNPSSLPRTDVVLVPLPTSEVKKGLVAVDDEGRRLPVQLLDGRPFWTGVCLAAFVARVPSMGYRAYRLERGSSPPVKRDEGCVIENEYFRVEADPEKGGSLRLVDKETGLVYEGLNVFVDEGDAGDEYNYSPPKNGDLVVVSTSFKARVEREVGPAVSVLRVSLEMEVPEKLEGQTRSRRTVRVPITSEIFLYKGVRRVDIRTTVDNRATDHRLRVRLPAGIHADKAAADSHFYVVERSVKPESDGKGWVEVPPTTHPQLYWVDVSDGSRGFTVANRGIPEYEVREENGGLTIYLTLFRSVGWLSKDDLETRKGHAGPPIPTPGAQCLRRMTFEYSLIPHQGTWFSSRSYLEARNFAEPLMAIALPGLVPSSKAFVSVKPETLVVTALKKAEDSDLIVLRFYNIAGERVAGVVRLGFECEEVWRANLDERPLEKIGDGNTVRVYVKPYEIVTLLIKPRVVS